jgi:hypothetical protein
MLFRTQPHLGCCLASATAAASASAVPCTYRLLRYWVLLLLLQIRTQPHLGCCLAAATAAASAIIMHLRTSMLALAMVCTMFASMICLPCFFLIAMLSFHSQCWASWSTTHCIFDRFVTSCCVQKACEPFVTEVLTEVHCSFITLL